MSYWSVWMRAPLATAASMTGWIVFCCTLASMRMTTCPPRWIKPRLVACPSPACRGPALPPVCDGVQAAPFCNCRRLALVPGHDVDLVDLDLARQLHRGSLGGQAAAQLLGHGLHIRPVEAQLLGNLAVREVQAHEVQAQHPDPQRLVMPGQHRAGEVVKAPRTRLAPISLPMSLDLVKAIADYSTAAAGRAANTLRPAMLAHQGKALGIV